MSVIDPKDYLTDAQILRRWPQLKASELRKARRGGVLSFYAFRSSPCSTPEQVQKYIDDKYLKGAPCQSPSDSRSATPISTSRTPNMEACGTPAAMTLDLTASAAEALKREILSRPKSGSRRSSPRPRKARTAGRLRLVRS